MSAPVTSIAGRIYEEKGAEALLRFVAECGGLIMTARRTNTNRGAWQRFINISKKELGCGWRDFLPAGTRVAKLDEPAKGDSADGSLPSIPHRSLATDVEDGLQGIDLSQAKRMPDGEAEIAIVASQMQEGSDDDEESAPKKVPASWKQERIPRRYEGGLQRPRPPEPAPDAPGQEWSEYLTIISDFYETVHSARLRTIPGKRYAALIPVADLHLGKEGATFRKFRALVEWVCDHDGYYLLGMGDLLNNPTLKSPEADQLGAQTATVGQSGRALAFALAEAAEKNKIIFLLTGNHEQRMVKATGQDVDPMQRLAEVIGVPFAGYEAPLILEVGDQTYSIYANHGTGGGQTMGYVLATLERMAANHRCDCVIMAHRHVKVVVERAHWEPVRVEGEIKADSLDSKDPAYEYRDKIDYHVAAGCFSKAVPSSFGRKIVAPPSVIGTVTLRLFADVAHKHCRL